MKQMISTPWGMSQTVTEIAPGILSVTTAGHGGLHLSEEMNAKVPAYMRLDDHLAGGWYEEDCAWSIVAVVFPEVFSGEEYVSAKEIFRACYPVSYEAFYGVTLKPGESIKKDDEDFWTLNQDNYLVIAAWGDWHKNVPTGMVGVTVGRGGRGRNGCSYPTDIRNILVPKDEYVDPSRLVLDPDKYATFKERV